MDDSTLLNQFVSERAEGAFAALVRRHVNLVFFSALRQVGGNTALAEEVTQDVFTDLARKAGSLAGRESIAGWLHTSTRFAAAKVRRTEARRRTREQEAQLMHEIHGTHDETASADWERIRPAIDDALHSLDERDREAVLLRFFEDRAWAEIGATLRLSEEAARKRVERALDRMAGALASRGITSTGAALGVALAHQAGAASPTGLASSVASAALAGAAAEAATAGAVGLLSIMSTINTSAATTVVALALAASIGSNLFLFTQASPAVAMAPAELTERSEVVGTSPPIDPLASAREGVLDPLRDQLRAEGASENAIRSVLEGILRRRYREKLSAERAARLQRGWWRDPQRTWGTAESPQRLGDDASLLRTMVTEPLEALLGPDPLDVAEADAKYSFLPSELRQAFGRLDRREPNGWSATGDAADDAARRTRYENGRRTIAEERTALLAQLTSVQRGDYDMRFGPLASGLARQVEAVGATEQEFRTVFPIADAYVKGLAAAAEKGLEVRGALKDALDRRVAHQLIGELGYDRALDFVWGGYMDYPAYARVAREAGLPSGTAANVLQLAAVTAASASAVHVDPLLNLDQKRAALAVIQQAVKPQLDALLPPAVQQRLTAGSLEWLHALGEGRYKPFAAVLPGRGNVTTVASVIAVSSPPPRNPVTPLMPARPGGN